MKSKFYQTSQENIETLLKYYESANSKIKKYYNKMTKYKKFTTEYCTKIKQLFVEENNIFNLNSSTEEYETIEIDYGINSKEIKNKLLYEEINEKRRNMAPILNSIDKINKFFNEYVMYLQLFIKGLEIPLSKLNQCIEVTNNEIISVKNNHNIQQKNYILKYCEYDSLNKELNKLYLKTEKKLVDYCTEKKNKKKKKIELDKLDEKLNLSITANIQTEEHILSKYYSLENFGKIFNDSTNEKINTIKDFTSSLFQKFDNFLRNIYNFFKKSFLMPMDLLLNQRKDASVDNEIKIKKDFDDLIDGYVKKIDEKSIKNNLDIYSPKILRKKNEEDESKDDLNLKKKNSFEILSFDKDYLEEEDIYYIIKNMYEKFKLINRNNYDLEVESKKLEIKEIFNKLISFGKRKKSMKNNSNKDKEKDNDWNVLDESNNEHKDKEINENNKKEQGNKEESQKEVQKEEKKEENKEEKKEEKTEKDDKKDLVEYNEESKIEEKKESENNQKDKEDDKNEGIKEEVKDQNKIEQKEDNKNEVESKEEKKEQIIKEEKNKVNNKEENNKIINDKEENNTKTNNKEKNKGITKQDVDYLCKYMNDPVYQRYFLIKLNNYRTLGIFEMPLVIFNYINQIFSEILKHIEKEKKYEKKENIFDIENTKIVIILSQTFYCIKEEQKVYLQKELKKEKLFKNAEFWKKILEISIENELKNYIYYCHKKNGESESDETMKEKKTSIAFAQMIPYINSMNEFGVNIDEIKSIVGPFIKEYEISEENQKVMFDIIKE